MKCSVHGNYFEELCTECQEKREPSPVLRESSGSFPVLSHRRVGPFPPKAVPLWWIEQFKDRIERNHGQSIETLSRRGGLGAEEMWCAANDRGLFERGMTKEEAAIEWLRDCMSDLEKNAGNETRKRG